MLERRHVLGGARRPKSCGPAIKVSTAAYVISLFLPQIIRELRLAEYGFRVLPRSPSSFTPLPDGRSLLMGPEPGLNQREIAKFSRRDAERYPRYNAFLERVAAVLEPVLVQARPTRCRCPTTWRQLGLGKRLRDGEDGGSCTKRWANWAPTCPRRSSCSPARRGRSSIAGSRATCSRPRWPPTRSSARFRRSRLPGSAYVLLHHVMGEAGGARGVWGYVQGGMGGLATALAARAATWASKSAAKRRCGAFRHRRRPRAGVHAGRRARS